MIVAFPLSELWSAPLKIAAKITLPLPLPSREGDKTLSPGGRGKGEGAKISDERNFQCSLL